MERKDTNSEKQWRLEAITPNSEGRWQTVFYFDDDKRAVTEDFVKMAVETEGVWEFRIMPNV